jgi:nucleotide-binding universal stress UspA family protein
MKEFGNILVVTRAGGPCRKAVHCGYSLSRRYKAALTLLHLVDQDPFELGGGEIPDTIEHDYDVYLAEAREVMDRAAPAEETKAFSARRLVRYGDPAEQVEKLVADEGFDLLVLPAHPEGRLEHFLRDRSRAQLLRDLPCSVLLIKEE